MGFATISHETAYMKAPKISLPVWTARSSSLRVELATRGGPILSASPFADRDNVLSLSLTQGCVHRCPFCTVRPPSSLPPEPIIRLYANTAEDLGQELKRRRRLPGAVYISPSSDPFGPSSEVQGEAVRVARVLAEHGIEAWFMTRGYIRPAMRALLAEHASRVKVTIALTTANRSLQRALEPLTAPPRLRVRQVAPLGAAGIRVQIALEPLLPGLTDTRENLVPLLEALAKAGVTHIKAGYAFLRSNIQDSLLPVLEPLSCAESVLEQYWSGPILSAGSLAPARYLPKKYRQRGYASLMALAAGYGITVGISALANPDFRLPDAEAEVAKAQVPLFASLLKCNR
jgi:DNA repair photolyase